MKKPIEKLNNFVISKGGKVSYTIKKDYGVYTCIIWTRLFDKEYVDSEIGVNKHRVREIASKKLLKTIIDDNCKVISDLINDDYIQTFSMINEYLAEGYIVLISTQKLMGYIPITAKKSNIYYYF